MNVYVSRDGETFGPYSDEQARQFLQSGQLLGSDYALYEGESEWKTLGDLLGVNQQTISPNQLQQSPDQSSQTQAKKSSKKENRGKKEYQSSNEPWTKFCCRTEARHSFPNSFNSHYFCCDLCSSLWCGSWFIFCFSRKSWPHAQGFRNFN